MITKEDARNTLEFDDYYVILSEIQDTTISSFYKNVKRVAKDFEYHSGNNDRWLSIEEMKKLISEVEI
jgi:UDP-N-acetylglucosamine 4,6-dehydratase